MIEGNGDKRIFDDLSRSLPCGHGKDSISKCSIPRDAAGTGTAGSENDLVLRLSFDAIRLEV